MPLGILLLHWILELVENCVIPHAICSSIRLSGMPSLITDAAGIETMRSSLARRVATLLLAQSLSVPAAFAQQPQTPQVTRPRRAQPVWTPPAVTTPIINAPALTTLTGP